MVRGLLGVLRLFSSCDGWKLLIVCWLTRKAGFGWELHMVQEFAGSSV